VVSHAIRSRLRVEAFVIERVAFIFEQLKILLDMAVEHEIDRPGLSKDLGIFDRDVVTDMVGIDEAVMLDEVQRVAVKIAGMVEPRLIVEIRAMWDFR
jgi:hypothetical protein